MTIDKISYSESHETISSLGLRRWYKFEAGATIDETEDKAEAVKALRQFVQENVFPDMAMSLEYASGNGKENPKPDSREQFVQAMIAEIEMCDRVDHLSQHGVQIGLLAYENPATKDPRIKAAYDLQMLKLKKQ